MAFRSEDFFFLEDIALPLKFSLAVPKIPFWLRACDKELQNEKERA